MSKINIVITAVDKASAAFRKVSGELNELSSRMTETGKSMMKVGGAMSAGVTLPLVAGFKAAADAARESQKIVAVTEQVIRSTGGAAKITAEQVDDLATSLSNKTAIDDEVILKGQQVMLTFTNIRNEAGAGNDIFTRASQAMLDLGTVFGSTDAAAMQLGKALNDPIKGIGALGKAGVSFTQAQKDQIKAFVASNDILSAQRIILAEVEKQVGGTAAAAATDYDRMGVAIGNLQESLGALLLPTIEKVARVVANLAGKFEQLSPRMQTMTVAGLAIVAAIGPAVTVIGALVTAVGFLLSPVGLVIALIAGLVAAFVLAYQRIDGFRAAVDTAVAAVRDKLAVWLPAAIDIARNAFDAFVGWVRDLWARWGDDIIAAATRVADWLVTNIPRGIEAARNAFDAFVGWVRDLWARWGDDILRVGGSVASWFVNELWPTIQRVGQYIVVAVQAMATVIGAVIRGIQAFWREFGDDIMRVVRTAFGGLVSIVQPILSTLWGAITGVLRLIRGDWSGAWEALKTSVRAAMDAVVAIVKGLGSTLWAAMRASWEMAKKGFEEAKELLMTGVRALPDLILKALSKLGDLLLEIGKDVVRGLANGISGAIDLVKDAATALANKLPGWMKKVLGISSPSKVFAEIGSDIVQGLIVGLRTSSSGAESESQRLAERIVSSFEGAISAVRGAYGAGKGKRGAEKGLVDAQERLNEVRARAATIDMRIAATEEKLAKAKQGGEEAAGDLRDAEQELAKLREEKARLPRDQADAVDALTDAQDQLTDATLAAFDAAQKLAEAGPNAIAVFEGYARAADVAEGDLMRVVTAANAIRQAIEGIPSLKEVSVRIADSTVTPPQYDPGSSAPTTNPAVNSGRRVENGVEYVWVEGIGWVRSGGGRASGGPVSAGTAYTVGERGPELFVPGRSGTIVPNGAMNVTVNVAGSILSERDLTAAVVDGLRRSGAVTPSGAVVVGR